MVAIGVDEIERPRKVIAVLLKPCLQFGTVRLVQIPPEDQAPLTFGVRARDGEHAVDPAAEFDAQADEKVESFRQVNPDLTTHSITHNGQGIGKRIGEMLSRQTGTVDRFFAECIAQTIISGQRGSSGQQILLRGRPWRQSEAVQRVLVGFEADVFEELRDAVARDQLAVLPVR